MAHDEHHSHHHGHEHGHAHGHASGHAHTPAPGGRDWAAFGTRLEREGELVRPVHDELIADICAALGDRAVRRVLDLGSGPGVATTLLAERFPQAHATAVDASEPLLALAAERAARVGVADRVDTAVVDLEQPLGTLAAAGAADVVWASMVLHHVASLPATLAEIRGVLAPGGVLALVEFGDERRALPEHAVPERPGFVERHADVTRELLAAHLPAGALEIQWPSALVAAGLEVVTHRRVVMERPAPLDAGERAFAKHSLEMAAHVGLHRFDDLDLLTLARLLDDDHPMSVMRRDDLPLRITRTIAVARRP